MSREQDFLLALMKSDAKLAAIDALRPLCPRCGGMSIVNPDTHDEFPCPDCEDGKVSIERLVKVFEAVWDDGVTKFYGRSASGILRELRGIR